MKIRIEKPRKIQLEKKAKKVGEKIYRTITLVHVMFNYKYSCLFSELSDLIVSNFVEC